MSSGDKHRRFSPAEKSAAVLRLLRGEPMDAVAEDLGTSPSRIERWRSTYTAAGFDALSQQPGHTTRYDKFERNLGRALPWLGLLLAITLIVAWLTHMLNTAHE